MHAYLWRGILKPPVAQNAKATTLFMCASGNGERSKHEKNKFKKLCVVAVNATVKLQLSTSKLNWTQKFPQPETFSQDIKKKQIDQWVYQIFYRVSIYYFLLLCQISSVGPYYRDIMQSCFVNHHKPWAQQEDQTDTLLSTTGWPAHPGSQILAENLHHTSSYSIMQTSKILPCLCAGCSTIFFFILKRRPGDPRERHSRPFPIWGFLNTSVFARHWPKHTLNTHFPTQI